MLTLKTELLTEKRTMVNQRGEIIIKQYNSLYSQFTISGNINLRDRSTYGCTEFTHTVMKVWFILGSRLFNNFQ